MRPEEDYFYYDTSQSKCINFPYTGACGGNSYDNAFPSYNDCMDNSWDQSQYNFYPDVDDVQAVTHRPAGKCKSEWKTNQLDLLRDMSA